MVIVKLMGGLGNQMFQYAAGRSIAARRRVPLKLDLSWFAIQTKRSFQLQVFNVNTALASPEEIEAVKAGTKQAAPSFKVHLLNRFQPVPLDTLFYENMLAPFNPEVPNARPPVYLEGYWQSEKYFLPIQTLIRREFSLRQEPSFATQAAAEDLRRRGSVSVHVRRGDYVHDPYTNQVHGTCTQNYYLTAARIIRERVPAARFYIFSDDQSWARANLGDLSSAVFVDHNPLDQGHEDLWLMKQCNHHIIANSSFSWWGAWLAGRRDKIVCAPDPWFNISVDTRDLLPASWLRVGREQ